MDLGLGGAARGDGKCIGHSRFGLLGIHNHGIRNGIGGGAVAQPELAQSGPVTHRDRMEEVAVG